MVKNKPKKNRLVGFQQAERPTITMFFSFWLNIFRLKDQWFNELILWNNCVMLSHRIYVFLYIYKKKKKNHILGLQFSRVQYVM